MPKEDTQFKKGNPWRPFGTRNIETLFRDAIEKVAIDQKVEDVERDLIITLLAKARKGDIRALEIYLDRLYGKPKQYNEHTGKDGGAIEFDLKDMPKMHKEEIEKIMKSLLK